MAHRARHTAGAVHIPLSPGASRRLLSTLRGQRRTAQGDRAWSEAGRCRACLSWPHAACTSRAGGSGLKRQVHSQERRDDTV